MPKLIAPNGCLFCELPHNIHGSRLDGLHPREVWTWVEPSDRVRLQRMKRNRAIREAIAMNENVGRPLDDIHSSGWTDQWVTYHGRRRVSELGHGQVFKVVEKREDGSSVGFDAGVFGIQWAAPWVLKIAETPAVEAPKPLTLEQAESILEPHSQTVETIDNEIARLTKRIEDLKIARQVIATL